MRAETGRVEDARAHVERCREIADAARTGAAAAGIVGVAEAVVLAAEGREADAAFQAAHETLERYGLVSERAECLHEWGRATGSAERLEQALELYRRYGAGAPWIERVGLQRA